MGAIGRLFAIGALSAISLPAAAHGEHRGWERHHHQGPARVYVAPAWRAPTPRHFWVPAHWGWHNHARVWIESAWALPPQPSWVWVEPRWAWNGATWVWQDGYWAPGPR